MENTELFVFDENLNRQSSEQDRNQSADDNNSNKVLSQNSNVIRFVQTHFVRQVAPLNTSF